jgi:hypothetical protein
MTRIYVNQPVCNFANILYMRLMYLNRRQPTINVIVFHPERQFGRQGRFYNENVFFVQSSMPNNESFVRSFLYLNFRFALFWHKNIGAKKLLLECW